MSGFTERRDLTGNRRAPGWRWGASRADRRKRSHNTWRINERRLGSRRERHRRRDDRDDAPRTLASGAPTPPVWY